jgi:hypothetical protein
MKQLTDSIPGEVVMKTMYSYNKWENDSVIVYPSGISIAKIYNSDRYLSEIKKVQFQTHCSKSPIPLLI